MRACSKGMLAGWVCVCHAASVLGEHVRACSKGMFAGYAFVMQQVYWMNTCVHAAKVCSLGDTCVCHAASVLGEHMRACSTCGR